MNIKLTLLVACTLTSLILNSAPVGALPNAFTFSPVLQNDIEVTINDDSYVSGDTYTIKIYYLGGIYSTVTTESLVTAIPGPTLWRGALMVEVEKNTNNGRLGAIPAFEIIATEVRFPNRKAMVTFI